jgi:hypothetical protein
MPIIVVSHTKSYLICYQLLVIAGVDIVSGAPSYKELHIWDPARFIVRAEEFEDSGCKTQSHQLTTSRNWAVQVPY